MFGRWGAEKKKNIKKYRNAGPTTCTFTGVEKDTGMTSVILNLKCNSRMATVWAGVARRGSVGAHEGLRTIRMPGMRLHHPEREEHQYYHPFFFFPFSETKNSWDCISNFRWIHSSLFFTTFQEGKKDWLLFKISIPHTLFQLHAHLVC